MTAPIWVLMIFKADIQYLTRDLKCCSQLCLPIPITLLLWILPAAELQPAGGSREAFRKTTPPPFTCTTVPTTTNHFLVPHKIVKKQTHFTVHN